MSDSLQPHGLQHRLPCPSPNSSPSSQWCHPPISSSVVPFSSCPQSLPAFFWAPKSLQMVIAAMKLKDAFSWEKSYYQPRQHIKKQRCYFANKVLSSQGYGFSSSHVRMWELDYKGRWVPKNWCFWTVVLEKVLESPLNCKEIKPFNPKGNQSWIFIGRTDAESWNSNTLATWCKEPTHWKRPWCWEKSEGGRRRGRQRMRWLDGITDTMGMKFE